MSIVAEAPGYIQVFSDGSVKRFAPEIAPPCIESSSNGYMSKDVVIDPSKPITARIFLPAEKNQTCSTNALLLPVVVYFHGGGFSIGSTTWLGYHYFLGNLSSVCKSIVLSVDYRLAPEYKLPIAYEDCYSSLAWLSSYAVKHEQWLQRADLSRVFLSGDSAGGNIAHQVAIRAIRDMKTTCRVKGLVPIHPYFGSEERTKLEADHIGEAAVMMNDMFWKLSLPEGTNRNYYGCNFEKTTTDLSKDEWDHFPAVVVHVAELDLLKERGVMYAEYLHKKMVKGVELVEAAGESHVYHIFHPESEATYLLQKQMNEFISSF